MLLPVEWSQQDAVFEEAFNLTYFPLTRRHLQQQQQQQQEEGRMRGGEGIMATHQHQHQHHRPVPPLKVPPRPTPRSFSFSHSGFSPSPSFSSSRSPFVSPSPTPKLRPRPPEAPAWLTILLHTVPLYIAYAWLSSHSSSSSSTTIVFAFLALLGSALGFGVLQQQRQPWQGGSSSSSAGRSMAAPPSQWGLLLANGLLIAASTLLKLEGVRSCGPLVALLAEYAGSVLGKFVLGDWASSSPGRIRGLLATAIALLLLAQGWTIESCSPLAIKERMSSRSSFNKMPSGGKCGSLPLWAPMVAGVLSACAKIMSTRTSLKCIPKKRVHGISTICAAVLMLPLALLQLDTLALVHASAWWPMSSMIFLGLAQSLRGDAHFEEKLLIPPGSPRHFAITCCCASLLELWFGLDISPLGFLACSALLALGVLELADPGTALSLDAIAKHEAQASLWALVKGPLRLITSDAKSGKIAAFLVMNAAFMVVEFAFGFTSNSLGLVSDACHMLFDCAALAIGLYASYISKLQPSSGFGYGYGRFEVLSGYANAVFLVLVASLIVLESIERILDPPEISTESLLVVSLGGLLVNLVGLVFFHEEHHHSHGGCSHDHSATTKPVQQEELSINLEAHGCSSALQGLSSSPATGDSGQEEEQGFHQSHHSHSCSQQQHSEEQLKHRSCDHQHHQHSHHEQCSSSHHHHHQHSPNHHDSEHQHSPDHHNNSAHSHHHSDHQHSPDHQHHPPDRQHSDHEQFSSDHQHSPNHHENTAHSHQSEHHHSPNLHESSAHQHHHHGNSAHSQHSCDHHGGHSLNHHNHADDEHHDHHHGTTAEDAHHHIDHNMRGIFLHVLADTLGSVGVVISTLLIKYKGWMFTDPACSIFISVMIIASVIPLLINSGEILLQRTPRSTQKRLKEAMGKIGRLQGVQGLERLHVWSFTNNEIVGTLHLHASKGTDKSNLRDKVSRLLNNVGITDMTIQVEDM